MSAKHAKTFVQLLITAATLSAALSSLIAQEIHEEVAVNLVEVYVAAVDKKGNPVRNLQVNDFHITENGKAQHITHFSRILAKESNTPLSVIFLIDTSGSMTLGTEKLRRIDLAKSFAEAMLQELKPSDQIELAAFDVQFRPLTPLTGDKEVIAKHLEKVKIPENRGTLLLGAINLAAAQLELYSGRRLIVLCSDGETDWRDAPTKEQLLLRLKKSDITVIALGTTRIGEWRQAAMGNFPSVTSSRGPFGGGYSIYSGGFTPRSVTPADRAKKLLETLAKETGGASYFPTKVKELDKTLGIIRGVIQSQYLLGYTSMHLEKGSWNQIDLQCRRKGVKLHYRKGYFVD